MRVHNITDDDTPETFRVVTPMTREREHRGLPLLGCMTADR